MAEEIIVHFTSLVGANVTVTRKTESEITSGTSDHVVCIVTENSRTLIFTSRGV